MNMLRNGSFVRTAENKDADLISAALQQMILTVFWCLYQKILKWVRGLVQNLIRTMIAKGTYIALGYVGNHIWLESYFESTRTYNTISVRWYIPCSVKYPR